MTEFKDDSIPQPKVAGLTPLVEEVQAGKTYWWCTCGMSQSQPFCDGSHKGSEFSPTEWLAEKDGKIAFCTCKHSKQSPICDGTHKQLNTQSK